ncbi:MAG: alpha/beta hydrolase [Sedimenticolaceae bacterium]
MTAGSPFPSETDLDPDTLQAAIDAPCHRIQMASAGCLSYYEDSDVEGRPLVLVHSINAAPSAMEMKPLFEHYRSRRPVYAPDLPGYGRSERGDRPYSPEMYAGVLCEFLSKVVKQPADIIAFSLSAEFAARAVPIAGDAITTLALLSPTGLSRRQAPSGKITDRLLSFFRLPVLGDGLYRLLTSRLSIRYFLGLSFTGPTPQALLDYAYATSHQPGAKHAPFRFLSLKLFTPGALEGLYRPLQLPVLVLYDRDPNVKFDLLDELVAQRPNWQAERIAPTLGLPHWEQLAATVQALDRFWLQHR